jgi:hypothetical protein
MTAVAKGLSAMGVISGMVMGAGCASRFLETLASGRTYGLPAVQQRKQGMAFTRP